MRVALVAVALCACGSAGHTRRAQHADPRWFCRAIDRGDLERASDAAASWLASTGSAPAADDRVRRRLATWLEAQACVTRVQLDGCARGLTMQLEKPTRWRTTLLAYVHGNGLVMLVDVSMQNDRCNPDAPTVQID